MSEIDIKERLTNCIRHFGPTEKNCECDLSVGYACDGCCLCRVMSDAKRHIEALEQHLRETPRARVRKGPDNRAINNFFLELWFGDRLLDSEGCHASRFDELRPRFEYAADAINAALAGGEG